MKTNAPKPNKSVIKGVKKKLKKIEKILYPTMSQVFNKYSGLLKYYNTQNQLFVLGQDAGAVSLGSYAESTKRIKIKKAQPADRVTLKDTGDFYKDITVTANDTEIIIEASISYAKWLTKRYGKEILGVQDHLLSAFLTRYVFPEIESEISKIIQK